MSRMNCSPLKWTLKLMIRYGEVDYIYGWKAFNEHNGFTNAQSALNVIELLMQICYLKLRKQPGKENQALLVGYSVSLMSLSKTVLYWLQEYYSGYVPGAVGRVDGLGTRKSVIIPSIDLSFCGLYQMVHGSYFQGYWSGSSAKKSFENPIPQRQRQ